MKINLDKLQAQLKAILQPLADLNNQLNEFLRNNPDFLHKVDHYLKNWPEYHKADWAKLATFGWFLNWETPITIEVALEQGKATVDAFMKSHLRSDWDAITDRIVSTYPERKHILSTAFELHQAGNFIASIPLFLSRADGICAQRVHAFLFSEHEQRSEKVRQLLDESTDSLTRAFLEVLNLKTQFGAGISSASRIKKDLAPNRNGILHGSRKHLDYATEINSFKAFSLLSFVVYCFDEKA